MAGCQPATHLVLCCIHPWGMKFLRTPHRNGTGLEAGMRVCECMGMRVSVHEWARTCECAHTQARGTASSLV